MKIIQICTDLRIGGKTTFINNITMSLKLSGHTVINYIVDCGVKTDNSLLDTSFKMFDYNNQTMIEEINSSDYVIVQDLLKKDTPEEIKTKYYDFIRNITPQKILFLNSHTIGMYRFYGVELFKDRDFMSMFDYISTFSEGCVISTILKETFGPEEYHKRFVHMLLTYPFDENVKKQWVDFEDKQNRVTYIGRFATFKHIDNVVKLHKYCSDDFEFEMRGIDRGFGPISIPDLFYEIDNDKKKSFKESIIGPSKRTEIIDKKWRQRNNVTEDDLLIQRPYYSDKIFIFGPYRREDGLTVIRNSLFGIEPFRLKKPEYYGDDIEYAMFEIVENGTVPIFDSFTANNIQMYNCGVNTGKTMAELEAGVFLDPDLNNAEEVVEKLKFLRDNKYAYNDLREKCWNIYKEHSDPVGIMNKFFEDIKKKA